MAYATKDDVKALFREFASTTDAAVSDTEIELFLDSSTEMIDARLNGLYSLPITNDSSPKSFKILKQINAFKVAAIVDDILNNYSNDQKKPAWDKRAEVMLDSIAPKKDSKTGAQPEPDSKLIDAIYLGTNVQQGAFKANTQSAPTFTKGGDNW